MTKDGKQLYTEQTPRGERYQRIIKHIAETQAPQYKQYLRVYDSATGKPDRNGDVIEIDKALAGIFGFRMIKLRPDKGLAYYITDFTSGERNARREFTGGPEGVIRPAKTMDDILERYFIANQSLYNVHKTMKQRLESAKKLGMSDDEIAEIFVKRGNKTDYGYLEEALFQPYFPSKKIQAEFERISEQTGLPNPFEQGLPIIERMYEEFTDKNLSGEWEFKLEDFLPQSTVDPQSSALPQQPMPNPSVIGQVQPQQMTTAQGLTPTEMALLSPEEQQIRLRQRGLM